MLRKRLVPVDRRARLKLKQDNKGEGSPCSNRVFHIFLLVQNLSASH